MHQLRGWSSLRTGLAVCPAGIMVALLAPRIAAPLVGRFGTSRVICAGLSATVMPTCRSCASTCTRTTPPDSPAALLHGYRVALIVPLVISVLGVLSTMPFRKRHPTHGPELDAAVARTMVIEDADCFTS
jgi:hypothetical protein